jgi:hypothetical protein
VIGLLFAGKTTAAILALAAQFLVSQRVLLAHGENNGDCLPSALDAAMRIVGHRVDAVHLARANADGSISPGVTADVVRSDVQSGDPTFGELERIRIELTGGAGLASGVAFGAGGLVRNANGHDHGTPSSGVPLALRDEGVPGHRLADDASAVVDALRRGPRVSVVMGGTVESGSFVSCHALTAVGVDPNTHAIVVLDPEATSREMPPAELERYFHPAPGHRTIFGCDDFAYAVE